MNKLKKLFRCLLISNFLFSVSVCAQQEISRLSGVNIPQTGTVLQLSYDPKGGPLEQSNNITGVVYMFINYRWSLSDVVLMADSGCWKGTFRVPDSCAVLAFKFSESLPDDQEVSDNNGDNGYVYVCIDQNKRRLPGGDLGWGLLRKPSLQKGIPGYFKSYEISDDAMRMWVSKELHAFPQYIGQYFDCYIIAMQLSKAENWIADAEAGINTFLKEPWLEERHYMMVRDLYRFRLNKKGTADSLEALTLARYPRGMTARAKRYHSVYFQKMDEKKLDSMEKFLKDFPPEEVYNRADLQFQRYMYYNIFKSMSTAYMGSKQDEKLKALIHLMDFTSLNETCRWTISRVFTLSLRPIEQLYPISDALIHEMVLKEKDNSVQDGIRYSPAQANRIAHRQFIEKLALHIRMLVKMGKYQTADSSFSGIPQDLLYDDADLNEAHVVALEKTGQSEKMFSVIEMSIGKDAATAYMLGNLKDRYINQHGSGEGFDRYMQSFKSTLYIENVKSSLKAKLVKVKVGFLTMSGLNGLTVTADMLKEKIVVLDFWATWCFPCKMSFSGMQLAVDKYAKDPTVDFYFIATMEKSKNYRNDIKEYMKTSGFRFNVLYDGINPKTTQQNRFFSTLATTFNSSAIPRKVILKDGYMRYTSEGYAGSPIKLMDEISYVIEMLKSEGHIDSKIN